MRIEQQHPRMRVLAQQRFEDHGDGAGFAGAGGAEHGEVLAEQVVGLDEGGQAAVVVQRADARGRDRRAGIDLLQVFLARERDVVAEAREERDAALERRFVRALFDEDFAEQLELGDLQLLFRRQRRRNRDADAADHGEGARMRRRHANDGADLDRPAGIFVDLVEQTDELRSRDGDHPSDLVVIVLHAVHPQENRF